MKSLKEKLKTIRFEFASDILNEKIISKSPVVQFEKWMQEAMKVKVNEPNAMTLATTSSDGFADARIVLLRDFSTKGFSFFSNYNSIKAREIRLNKKACLNFFWAEMHRQVRIKGVVTKLSSRSADVYFASRPRESQIAAWASHQSEELNSRSELDERYRAYEKEFKGKKVHRPKHWGGYNLKPVYFEFWQGQTNRLHDRIVYELSGKNKWILKRLNP